MYIQAREDTPKKLKLENLLYIIYAYIFPTNAAGKRWKRRLIF